MVDPVPIAYALLWRPGRLDIYDVSGDEGRALSTLRSPLLFGGGRFDVGLFAANRLMIALPELDRIIFHESQDGGLSFIPIAPIPGTDPILQAGRKAHANDVLTAITGPNTSLDEDSSQTVWVRRGSSEWLPHELPRRWRAYDVSLDSEGRVWLAGSVRNPSDHSGEGPNRNAALGMFSTKELHEMPLRLNSARAFRRCQRRGALTHFQRIDASEQPKLVTSSSAWFFENPSEFLFASKNEHWTYKYVRRDSIRSWSRHKNQWIDVFTVNGSVYSSADKGLSWRKRSFARQIKRALSRDVDTPLMVNSAVSLHELMVLAVSALGGGGNRSDAIAFSAVLVSTDGGHSFQEKLLRQGPDAEFIAVALR